MKKKICTLVYVTMNSNKKRTTVVENIKEKFIEHFTLHEEISIGGIVSKHTKQILQSKS